MNATTQRANFAANLKWLCRLRTSIADVCRATGINRQQFNRYLAGTSVPSALIMRRICALFGVAEELMFQPPSELEKQLAISKMMPSVSRMLRDVGAHPPKLSGGYYYCYQKSTRPGPDRVVRTLYQVSVADGSYWFKGRRSFHDAGRKPRGIRHERMYGTIVGVDGLSYFMEGYSPYREGASLAVFGGPAAGTAQMRAGLMLQSCSLKRSVSRAALEYLGERPDLRKALASCGYLPLETPGLCHAILDLIMPMPGEIATALDAHPNILR